MKSPMLAALSTWPASVSEKDRADLTKRAVTAYQDSVIPAFKKLDQFVESRYLPACRATTRRKRLAQRLGHVRVQRQVAYNDRQIA